MSASVALVPLKESPPTRLGVVLVNVGTPQAPTVPAVRQYLAEFLGDPRVIDLPTWLRWLLLNLVILPFRPRRSAHAYQQIWTPSGSPLLLHSRAQTEALRQALPACEVVLAMRYGGPSLKEALGALKARGATRAILVPLYPQYAKATTGTTVEAWFRLLAEDVSPLATWVLPPFFGQPGFIEASAERVRATVAEAKAEHVLFSYHGLPLRQLAPWCEGTCTEETPFHPHCYKAQCYQTTRLIVQVAEVTSSSTAFQSRLKGATWLSPFTDEAVVKLGQRGVKRLAVACPSFVADCLETLEEIGQRAKDSFVKAGGESLTLIPAVNDSPRFIASLAEEIRKIAL